MFMFAGRITRPGSLLLVVLLAVACGWAVPASAKSERGERALAGQTASPAAAPVVDIAVASALSAPAVARDADAAVTLAADAAVAPAATFAVAPGHEPLSLAPGSGVRPEEATPASLAKQAEASEAALSFLNRDHFRALEVTATGYYAGPESTGKSPGHPEYGITYSGVKVRKGLFSTIAADTRVFPLGTILYIPGYGFGVVSDTGSAIKGNKIDLYFETKQQVYDLWGKKKVKVSVLRRGDGKVTEDMLNELNAIADTGATRADAKVD